MSEKVEIGKTGQFEDGVMREVTAGEREIIVVRLGDAWYAADARCPHMRGRLAVGTLEDTVVTCPLHGSKFDLKDGSVRNWVGMTGVILKAVSLVRIPRALRIYNVEVEGDSVMVEL